MLGKETKKAATNTRAAEERKSKCSGSAVARCLSVMCVAADEAEPTCNNHDEGWSVSLCLFCPSPFLVPREGVAVMTGVVDECLLLIR